MARRIKIFDTTLRDGEQSPGCSMNMSEKLRMAEQLDALGGKGRRSSAHTRLFGHQRAAYEI